MPLILMTHRKNFAIVHDSELDYLLIWYSKEEQKESCNKKMFYI